MQTHWTSNHSITSTLPPITIVGFEVSNFPKTDNIDELLIYENGVTSLTVWTEIYLTAISISNPFVSVAAASSTPESKPTPPS
uniref:Ovule protein n=1 Tax=Panagrolaimus sp. PS1159 TaxID=55785 RepID=A0AC35GYM5_9BILA